jgi:hypothetical protein
VLTELPASSHLVCDTVLCFLAFLWPVRAYWKAQFFFSLDPKPAVGNPVFDLFIREAFVLITCYTTTSHWYRLIIATSVKTVCFSSGATALRGPRSPHYRSFTIIRRHTTFDWTPLDKWSAQRTELYQTTHNTHKNRHPCPLRYSNPQSQQAKGLRPGSLGLPYQRLT